MKRPRPAGAAAIVLAALLTTVLGAGTASAEPANAAPSQVNPTERAAAGTRPAIVRVFAEVAGVVFDENGKALHGGQAIETGLSCTGFGVNANGYIATAGHCVDNVSQFGLINSVLREAAAQEIVAANPTVDPQVLLRNAAKWTVVGPTPDSPTAITMSVVAGSLDAGAEPKAQPAEIVGYRAFDDGDVALVRIDATNLPTLPLASDADVQVGEDVLSIGFPGTTDLSVDKSMEPSFKDGRVSSKKTKGGVPTYETSAAVSQGMSGGPTVDLGGRVLGVNSWKPVDESQAFNFIAPSSGLAKLMISKGVRNEGGPVDTEFQAALEAYWAGRYSDTITALDKVLALSPGHAQALQLRGTASDARNRFGDAPVAAAGSGLPFGLTPLLFWSIVGGGGALLLLIVALLVVRARRRRRAALPGPTHTPPFGAQPFGPPPFGPSYGRGQGPVPMNGPGGWAPAQPAWQPAPSNGVTAALPATTGTATLSGPPPCIRCASQVSPGAAYCAMCGHAQHS